MVPISDAEFQRYTEETMRRVRYLNDTLLPPLAALVEAHRDTGRFSPEVALQLFTEGSPVVQYIRQSKPDGEIPWAYQQFAKGGYDSDAAKAFGFLYGSLHDLQDQHGNTGSPLARVTMSPKDLAHALRAAEFIIYATQLHYHQALEVIGEERVYGPAPLQTLDTVCSRVAAMRPGEINWLGAEDEGTKSALIDPRTAMFALYSLFFRMPHWSADVGRIEDINGPFGFRAQAPSANYAVVGLRHMNSITDPRIIDPFKPRLGAYRTEARIARAAMECVGGDVTYLEDNVSSPAFLVTIPIFGKE